MPDKDFYLCHGDTCFSCDGILRDREKSATKSDKRAAKPPLRGAQAMTRMGSGRAAKCSQWPAPTYLRQAIEDRRLMRRAAAVDGGGAWAEGGWVGDADEVVVVVVVLAAVLAWVLAPVVVLVVTCSRTGASWGPEPWPWPWPWPP